MFLLPTLLQKVLREQHAGQMNAYTSCVRQPVENLKLMAQAMNEIRHGKQAKIKWDLGQIYILEHCAS